MILSFILTVSSCIHTLQYLYEAGQVSDMNVKVS